MSANTFALNEQLNENGKLTRLEKHFFCLPYHLKLRAEFIPCMNNNKNNNKGVRQRVSSEWTDGRTESSLKITIHFRCTIIKTKEI